MSYIEANEIRGARRFATRYKPIIVDLCASILPTGFTPVTSAADFNHAGVLQVLAGFGVPLDRVDGNGWAAIHIAVRRGYKVHITLNRIAQCTLRHVCLVFGKAT
jgi:ankyrin repeat protein